MSGLRRDYNPYVILVKSKYLSRENAKSFVFRNYKDIFPLESTYIFHEHDDDLEISKLSAFYNISFSCDQIQSMMEEEQSSKLRDIVASTFSAFFSRQNIALVCFGVSLKEDEFDVRSLGHAIHLLRSEEYIKNLRQTLENQTIQIICKSLGFEIYRQMLFRHSNRKHSVTPCDEISQISMPFNVYGKMLFEATTYHLQDHMCSACTHDALSVKINSRHWREKVAKKLHKIIKEKQENIAGRFNDIFLETQAELKDVFTKLESYKKCCQPNSQTKCKYILNKTSC